MLKNQPQIKWLAEKLRKKDFSVRLLWVGTEAELRVFEAFLKWKSIPFESIETLDTLRYTHGGPGVAVFINEKFCVIGFRNFIKYYENKRLW